MELKSLEKEGVVIHIITGEINITTSPHLRKLFESQNAKKVIIDMEKVNYIDSSGLATLVEVLKRIKSQGGVLALSGMSDKVKSLFEITKLDKLFGICPNQQEAIIFVNK